MPIKKVTNNNNKESRNNETSSRKRLAIPVFFIILLLLAILHIGNTQTGLKGFKGYVVFPTLNSATFFKSSSSHSELIFEDLVDDEKHYVQWLSEERRKAANITEVATKVPIVALYRAMAGLGHQLLRMSSAYNMLSMYQIPYLWPTANPVCGGTIFTIYEHVIGEGPILVDIPYLKPHNAYDEKFVLPGRFPNLKMVNETDLSDEERKELVRAVHMNNEVPFYAHSGGSSVWPERELRKFEHANFYNKFQTDYQFYHQLMLLFEHKHQERIDEIKEKTRFNKHTVFALHLRTGNGEKGDFQMKQRGFVNLDQWLENVIELLCDYRQKHSSLFYRKPFMIYVGTDTGSVVPKLQNISSSRCEIPIVSADQAYPEEGRSVSFLQKYNDNEKCLQGWENMFLDMYFFTRANTVVTGSYSSFSQSAPLSFMMQKAKRNLMIKSTHPHYFCELGSLGNRMDCYEEMQKWLRRTKVMSWGNMTAPQQRMKHEIPFPNYRVKSNPSITKLFAKTLLREPQSGSSSSTSRMTFQEWMRSGDQNTTTTNTTSWSNGIKGTTQRVTQPSQSTNNP